MTLQRDALRHALRDAWPVAAIAAVCFLGIPAIAQQQPHALPTFAVDASWPKVPERYKLGDISSIAIDAQDNAYVLHRPRTLKAEDMAKAAPPVIHAGRLQVKSGAGSPMARPRFSR